MRFSSENSSNFSQYSTTEFPSLVLLTEIKWIFTESQRHSLIQIKKFNFQKSDWFMDHKQKMLPSFTVFAKKKPLIWRVISIDIKTPGASEYRGIVCAIGYPSVELPVEKDIVRRANRARMVHKTRKLAQRSPRQQARSLQQRARSKRARPSHSKRSRARGPIKCILGRKALCRRAEQDALCAVKLSVPLQADERSAQPGSA